MIPIGVIAKNKKYSVQSVRLMGTYLSSNAPVFDTFAWIALALHLMTGRHVADSHQCQRPGAPRWPAPGSEARPSIAPGLMVAFAAWQHCVAADASAL